MDRSETGGILPPDSIAVATVDGLRIREAPSASANVLTTMASGERVDVIGNPNGLGPVSADGFDWYPVLYPADWEPGSEIIGWAAAGPAGDPLLVTVSATCHGVATDLVSVTELNGFDRLRCFGDQQLTFEGTYGCGGCGGMAPGTFTPAWLAHPIGALHVINADIDPRVGPIGRMGMRLDPARGLADPVDGTIIRVVGHFDDPAAVDCVMSPGPPGEETPADARAAVMACREQFVMESYEVLGTDPDWNLGG